MVTVREYEPAEANVVGQLFPALVPLLPQNVTPPLGDALHVYVKELSPPPEVSAPNVVRVDWPPAVRVEGEAAAGVWTVGGLDAAPIVTVMDVSAQSEVLSLQPASPAALIVMLEPVPAVAVNVYVSEPDQLALALLMTSLPEFFSSGPPAASVPPLAEISRPEQLPEPPLTTS
jgi:hypothetical protein